MDELRQGRQPVGRHGERKADVAACHACVVDVEAWLTWLRTGEVPADWRERVDDPREAELSLLAELRSASDDHHGRRSGLLVDRLELEGCWPDTALRVEFRAERRYPRCRFMW